MKIFGALKNHNHKHKFLMALLAAVIAAIKVYHPDFPDEALYTIVGTLLGYVALESAVEAMVELAKWLAKKKQEKQQKNSQK